MEFKELKIGLIGGGRGGINLAPAQRELAEKYRVNRMVCRKCIARLPAKAHNCRKKKCGHCADIRIKKKFKDAPGMRK
jgi:ribosomal protein L40E